MPSSDLGAAVRGGVAGLALALALAACGSTAPSVPGPSGSGPPSAQASSVGGQAASSAPIASAVAAGISSASKPAATVTATLLDVRLPAGRSRAVVAPDGTSVLVIGGLTAQGTTGTILRLDPAALTVTPAGRLASAVHDAAGAALHGTWLVIGGGRTVAVPNVQSVSVAGGVVSSATAGSLPAARADHAAAAAGGLIVVAAGGRGGVADPSVLTTRDGAQFTAIGRLPVPVRYAAAAAVGTTVYLFGGSTAKGDTAAIQAVNPSARTVRSVGRLPRALTEATAFVLSGRVLIVGGMRSGTPLDTILSFDPASGRTTVVGRLPRAVADAGVAVVGDTAYLVGGETGTTYLDTVIAIR